MTAESPANSYAHLDRALNAAGLGRAPFLNWGYAPVAGCENRADGPSPDAGPNAMQERLVRELIGSVPLERRRILDVGCGRGGTLSLMAHGFRPLSLSGIDLSPENIMASRRLLDGTRARLQIADACALPQADGSQDVVFNLESSGAYPDIIAFFRHVRRVLTKDGVFLYGDLWPHALLAPMERTLRALGFVPDCLRNVTRQVLAARRLAPTGILDRLSAADPAFVETFGALFATPGTAMWRCLERGDVVYSLGHWRVARNDAPPDAVDSGDAATIRARPTVLGQLLEAAQNDEDNRSRWFPFSAPRADAEVNVLAFPFAGAGASIFREWADYLPESWAFCPVQLPGREHRVGEPAFDSVDQAMAGLMPLLDGCLHRPLALMGWSLGGKLAFELAERLERECRVVVRLIFIGACPAPDIPVSGLRRENDWAETLSILGGTPPAVLDSPAMLQAIAPALDGDLAMATHYRSDAVVRAPILAVAAEDDHLVPVTAVASWQARTQGAFRLERRRGGHFLLREQTAALAGQFARALLPLLDSPKGNVVS